MHLNSEAIIDLIEGRSDSRHAEECSDCSRLLEDWKQLHSRLLRPQLEDAPAALLKAALEIPGRKKVQEEVQEEIDACPKVIEVLASVIFDSSAQPELAGMHGAGSSREVVLRASEFDVHVRVSGDPDNRRINGQILTHAASGFTETGRVQLLNNGMRIRSVALDPLGEFEFQDLPEGLLSLQVDLPNLTVIGALGSEEVA